MKDKIQKFFMNRRTIIVTILLTLLPFVCALISLWADGKVLSSLWLPQHGNDEVIYLKLVDSVVNYGYPRGHFGYNEGVGTILSFSTWSPVLLVMWSIFGKLFGWNAINAVVCNLFLLSFSLFLFAILVKPNYIQTTWLSITYFLTKFITTTALTILPECTCYALCIVVIGLFYSAIKRNSLWKIILLFFLGILLTLMRPYYLLLFFFPCYLLCRKYSLWSLLYSVPISLSSLVLWKYINDNFCSKMEGLLQTSFIDSFKEYGILKGMFLLGSTILGGLKFLFQSVGDFLRDGSGYGFALLAFIMVILTVIIHVKIRKKQDYVPNILFLLIYLGFIGAIILFFCGPGAEKHTCEFIVMGIFIIAIECGNEKKWLGRIMIIFTLMALLSPPTQRIYAPTELKPVYDQVAEQLNNTMELAQTQSPSWDNTVDWVFSDTNGTTPWETLSVIPAGFGINLVFNNWFMIENQDIKAKYIATIPDGLTEEKCKALGGILIAKFDGLVIYQMR